MLAEIFDKQVANLGEQNDGANEGEHERGLLLPMQAICPQKDHENANKLDNKDATSSLIARFMRYE